MEHRPSVLVVDDDDTFRSRLARAFRDRGYSARDARNYDEAIAAAACSPPEYAVVDLRMPGRSGLDVVRKLKEIVPSSKVVILTGYARISTAIEGMRLGAHHYMRKPADADEIIEAFGLQPRSKDLPDKRSLLGAFAAHLSPDDLRGSLDTALDALREVCGADDSELFLAEPRSGELFMAVCRGPDRSVLMEQAQFAAGTGFPGIVVTKDEPLATQELPAEPRFLRTRVKQHGLQTYVCVPVPGVSGPLGTMSLVWRRNDVAIHDATELLQHAAVTLGATIRAGLAGARDSVTRAIGPTLPVSAKRRHALLAAVLRTSGARDATIILPAKAGSQTTTITSTQRPSRRNAPVTLVHGQLPCPALLAAGGAVLSDGCANWPDACYCNLPPTAHAPSCVPLISNGELRGAIVLDYGDAQPSPSTRDVVPLLAMAREATVLLPPNDSKRSKSLPGTTKTTLPVLAIRCFGKFEICIDGEVVEPGAFPRKKALALLKLLILQVGSPISRDALIEHLWPGTNGKAGANRLHGVVHALRSVIEPYRQERRWRYVRNEGDLYYLNTESAHSIDLYAFREMCSTGRRAERSGDVAKAMRCFDDALSLYRGELFADDPYEEWSVSKRDATRQAFVDTASQMADLCLTSGDAERAVTYLRRGLDVDPLREDLHQTLIRALAEIGRRGEALDQYNECVRVLRDELGARPLPETRRLEQLVEGTLR